MIKNESGRSMVEMLGVLAIIGVLSIGGIAGYTLAMNRYRANTLLDYVTRCVVTSQTKGVTGMPAGYADTGTATYEANADYDCKKVLGEAYPGFLGDGPEVWISGYDKSTDATKVKATTVSTAVDKVLKDKFSCPSEGYATCQNISGVKYSGLGEFTFQNSAN